MRGISLPTERDERIAVGAFVAVLVFALFAYLRLGDDQWFFLDEWDFLADRELRSLDDLLRPHNEHWSTLPIVLYRLLYRTVGLNSYVPYQFCTILLHLAAAWLLRAVMRRAGVRPLLATVAAGVFALFGSGRQNIVWGFQVGFSGALVAGLGHLLLADHDGRIGRRDVAGVVVGAAGLLCSGVAVAMTGAVGVATLLRRGWRAALFHTGPLAVLYLAWYAAYGSDAYGAAAFDLGRVWDFVATAVTNVFGRMGHLNGVGLLIGLLLVLGLALRLVRPLPGESGRRSAAALALLVGGLAFFVIAGVGRASGIQADPARASRYVHLGGAFALPTIAVAAESLARRHRAALVAAAAILVVGVPGNVGEARAEGTDRFTLGNEREFLTLASSPVLPAAPADLRPFPRLSIGVVTVGWIADGVSAGRIPELDDPDPGELLAATILLAFDTGGDAPAGCETLGEPAVRRLDAGDAVRVSGGPVRLTLRYGDQEVGPVRFVPEPASTWRARFDGVTVRVGQVQDPTGDVEVCGL